MPPPRDAAGAPGAGGPDADDLRRRLMDGLQLIVGLIERRLYRAEGAEAREALSALLGDVSALGAVQRRFAEGDSGGLADGLSDLGATWRRLAAGCGVSVEVAVEPVAVDERRAIALALAANELVASSIKQASADGGGGRVNVALRGGGGWGELHVSDDGRGLVDGMGPDSLGLGLIVGLLRRVGAELRLDGMGATRAHVRFPSAGHDGPDAGAPRPPA